MITQLASSATFNLRQLHQVISQTGSLQYASSMSILFGSSIGMHVRHIIEFYQCLLQGNSSGTVNYDARKRDLRIENDVDHASEALLDCVETINELDGNADLLLITSVDGSETQCHIPTNIFRELTYLIEHSIHHMAIIKMAFNENYSQIEIPENFGVAYSTIKHKQCVHSNVSAS